jgi:hypothetical protein
VTVIMRNTGYVTSELAGVYVQRPNGEIKRTWVLDAGAIVPASQETAAQWGETFPESNLDIADIVRSIGQ